MVETAQNTRDIIGALFDSRSQNGFASRDSLRRELLDAGILSDDPRAKLLFSALEASDEKLTEQAFRELVAYAPALIEQSLQGNLTVPDFREFSKKIFGLFNQTIEFRQGAVASYIPQLARVEPDKFAVALCTTAGQRYAVGDVDDHFCVQSCGKPFTYLLALEDLGLDVHKYVGREPSGKSFNEITFNTRGLPHNPMINAGAIICSALIKKDSDPADKFDYVLERWRAAAGGMRIGFNNAVYLSERQTADRNFALAYLMRENGAFPTSANLVETLELYFQCCSIEVTAKSLATVASTLANGGVCPLTGQQIFQPDYVKHCLSLMSSCGMYDFSGEFAFRVGLPAKSGVSGAVMVVVPNVMGMCVWSPRLDELGNSARGVEFCKRLVDTFNFHTFDQMTGIYREKSDPTKSQFEQDGGWKLSFIWAAASDDVLELKRLLAKGANPDAADYDGRTALHVAASEGHVEVIEFLLGKNVDPNPIDRWNNTPLDDARRHGHKAVQNLLGAAGAKTHEDLSN